ncbi:MAG: 3-deoxy-manno-octulosonate cytidylyltransferase [candidate division Zixibacteria bacterium]|nr:3-deoxy-manno-octulosonate cytidylyltransferase [candidate division Zixibacteria bacterium]
MADTIAIIPARLGSTRFPRKVLHLYRGKPLLEYVYDEVSRSKLIDQSVVATDSMEVKRAVEDFGGQVVLTSKRHRTGSDRVAEAAKKFRGSIFVNIQADNFGVKARVLDRVILQMKKTASITFATFAYKLNSEKELRDPNLVKVVTASDGRALWFSRSPIPYVRDTDARRWTARHQFLGHIGIYFYRRSGLMQFARWKRAALEKAESLEQLRILENGGRMVVFRTKMQTVSVDVPQDVKKLDSIYK